MFDFSTRETYIVVLLVLAVLSGSGVLIYKDVTTGKITVVTELDDQMPIDRSSYGNDQQDEQIIHEYIFVDVGGAVVSPGVYKLQRGARVFEAIQMAGGLNEDAYLGDINQAAVLHDAQKVYVPVAREGTEASRNEDTMTTVSGGKVRVNVATSLELQAIPGIGPVLADRIVRYRKEHGPFSHIEDLKQVSGIGPKTYEQIRDYVTIE